MKDLKNKFETEQKVLDMLYGELGKAEAQLFSAQCRVKVCGDMIAKRKKKMDKEIGNLRWAEGVI